MIIKDDKGNNEKTANKTSWRRQKSYRKITNNNEPKTTQRGKIDDDKKMMEVQ